MAIAAAYRGRIEITCLAAACPEDQVRENVTAACVACEQSAIRIIDLDDNIIKDVPPEKIRPAKQRKKQQEEE